MGIKRCKEHEDGSNESNQDEEQETNASAGDSERLPSPRVIFEKHFDFNDHYGTLERHKRIKPQGGPFACEENPEKGTPSDNTREANEELTKVDHTL